MTIVLTWFQRSAHSARQVCRRYLPDCGKGVTNPTLVRASPPAGLCRWTSPVDGGRATNSVLRFASGSRSWLYRVDLLQQAHHGLHDGVDDDVGVRDHLPHEAEHRLAALERGDDGLDPVRP